MLKTGHAFFKNFIGQTLMEYVIVMGLVTAILITMTPMVRRGTQGMIKTVADQIGTQNEADQTFDDRETGFLDSTYSATRVDITKQKGERVGVFNYVSPLDTISVKSNAFYNLGFTKENPP